MPRFGVINERRHQLHEVIRLSGMNLNINDTDHPLIIKVASIPTARMQVYFIDNEHYFKKKVTWFDAKDKLVPDNDERAIFFARGVLGNGPQAVLGPGHHPLPRLDGLPRSPVPQGAVQGRCPLREHQNRDQPVR